jgi:hypothetical protein
MMLSSDSLETGTGGSNSLRSANQSVHCAYILEKAETLREMRRSFSAQRTGESRLTPGSPDWASILSVRNKQVRFSGLSALWAAFAQPSPSRRDRKLNLNQSCLSVRARPRQIDAAENRTLLHAESVALRRPFERQIDAVQQRLGVLLTLADRFHDCGCSERQAPLRLLRSGAELWLTNVLVFSLWYWRLDGGGPNERDKHPEFGSRSFVFPQMQIEKSERERFGIQHWRSGFVDYLFISFTQSSTFGPTDAPLLARWVKLLAMVQIFISLSIVILLIARAVGVL